ncbi:hypothetical protein OAV88_03590 [bacterium]|nr:hypothetical protein [bacterium]
MFWFHFLLTMGTGASVPSDQRIAIQGPLSPFVQEASLIKCATSFGTQDQDKKVCLLDL